MKRIRSIGLVTTSIVVQLLVVGCDAGAGGIFGLFGGTEASEVLSNAFTSGGSGGSSGGSGTGSPVDLGGGSGGFGSGGGSSSGGTGGSGSGGGITPDVGSVHHPEPASIALFGGGLLSMGLRRRKSRQRKL